MFTFWNFWTEREIQNTLRFIQISPKTIHFNVEYIRIRGKSFFDDNNKNQEEKRIVHVIYQFTVYNLKVKKKKERKIVVKIYFDKVYKIFVSL